MTETLHGIQVEDRFRGMEARSPYVTAWVERQDKEARAFLAQIPLRPSILSKLEARRQEPRWTQPPVRRKDRYFYSQSRVGHEHGLVLSFDPRTGHESTIVDLDTLGGTENMVVDWWNPSRDGRFAFFRMSPNRSDAVQARIFDIGAGQWLPERIADVRFSYAFWDQNSRGFYYTWSPQEPGLSAEKRAAQSQLRYHALGTDPDTDHRVKDPSNQDGAVEAVEVSVDNRWLFAARYFSASKNSLWLFDRQAKLAKWVQFTPDGDAWYEGSFGKDAIYVSTAADAPHGHAFAVDPRRPERPYWREIVPERADAILLGIEAISDFLVFTYLRDAERIFEVRRTDGSFIKTLESPNGETISGVNGRPDRTEAISGLSSYTQPYAPYIVELPQFSFKRFPTASLSESMPSYITQKVFYTSPDGTRAPIFIVRSKNTPAGKSAPLMLYAYGAYGSRTEPGYRRGLEAWLDQGGIYAEAVIRGGGEYGDEWHRAGMREKRANTYADFIAASEHLIHDGWTASDKLVIRGGSAGGLLVTVALTERPDLYAGVIAEDPLTDMVRYSLSGNGPLWLDEFGSPQKEPELRALYRFSPYHRVRRGVRYPPVLVMSSADDDRVDPMHSRKLVAALKDADPAATVLMRTEPKAAHGGANSESAWMNAQADIYAFAFAVTHKTPQ